MMNHTCLLLPRYPRLGALVLGSSLFALAGCGSSVDVDARGRAHVEDPDGSADGVVLFDRTGVFQRHRPAAELGKLGTQRYMALVQRGRQQLMRASV